MVTRPSFKRVGLKVRARDHAVNNAKFQIHWSDLELHELVFSYRQLMEQVLHHSQRRRPIVSLPYSLGMIQGRIFEVLPETILTVTRSQVSAS